MTAIVPISSSSSIIRIERTSIPRRVVQLCEVDKFLFVLADDGTVWDLSLSMEWHQVPSLPPREEK